MLFVLVINLIYHTCNKYINPELETYMIISHCTCLYINQQVVSLEQKSYCTCMYMNGVKILNLWR